MKQNFQLLCILLIFTGMLLSACQSVPETVPEDLSQQQFFQAAQEFVDEENYPAALFYLEEFAVRYPDDQYNLIAADYQVALIHYKQGELETAEAEFSDIISRFETAEPDQYPAWVEVLSKKLLEKVQLLLSEDQ